MLHHNTPRNQQAGPTEADPADRSPLARRTVLGLSVGLALTSLVGCASSSKRRSSIGDPIPDSPRVRNLPSQPHHTPVNPTPRQQPAPPRQIAGVQIIGRHIWASYGPNTRLTNPMGRIRSITVHHDGMTPFDSTLFDDAARRLESIRRSHVGSQRWADIGYHYAVDPAGRVWDARPDHLQGAHVRDRNKNNLGIVVLGNFERQRPSNQTLDALDRFIAAKMDEHRIDVNRVYTHRELASTACPGRHLQSHMLAARGSQGSIIAALNATHASRSA